MAFTESEEDLARKYAKTYVKYNGEIVLFGDIEDGECNYFDANTVLHRVPWNIGLLEELYFDSCVINENLTLQFPHVPCIQISRNPKRQWRRSICSDNIVLSTPSDFLTFKYNRGAVIARELNFYVVEALQHPIYPTLAEAFALLPKCVCVAVSPQYYLLLSNIHPKRALLGSLVGLVGEFHPMEGIIVRHAPALQECKDFVNRTHQSYNVCLK